MDKDRLHKLFYPHSVGFRILSLRQLNCLVGSLLLIRDTCMAYW